jgi:hypothetical protein
MFENSLVTAILFQDDNYTHLGSNYSGWWRHSIKLKELYSSMEQTPTGKANIFSANQEIPCHIWNMKVYYCVDRSLPGDHILSYNNFS